MRPKRCALCGLPGLLHGDGISYCTRCGCWTEWKKYERMTTRVKGPGGRFVRKEEA